MTEPPGRSRSKYDRLDGGIVERQRGVVSMKSVPSSKSRVGMIAPATGSPTPPARPRISAQAGRGNGTLESGLEAAGTHWTFLTNHSHVIILLARNPSIVLRHVAAQVGITERAVQRIIADLEADGFLEREKVGRQNRYRVLTDRPLRHSIEAHRSLGDLLALLCEANP
jgi:predicted transcriptional regulator